MIINRKLKLDEPSDVRNLIRSWLRDVAETGELPFKGNIGGVVVQLMNTWLRAYEAGELEEIEARLSRLEEQKP